MMRPNFAFAEGNCPLGLGHPAVSPPGPALLDRLFLRISSGKRDAAENVDRPANEATVPETRLPFASGVFAIFAPHAPEALSMKNDIESANGTAMIIPQSDLPEIWLRTYAPHLTGCIVAHDFDDADAAVDFCLRLRSVAPDLVILLTLRDVKRDDLGPERMPICEATLRRPVSRANLFLGIQAACDNRAAYDRDHGSDCPMTRILRAGADDDADVMVAKPIHIL